MAWTYEIAQGDALNSRWKAFVELAQALRSRIVATDGSDTNAPAYELPNGTTKKNITMDDFTPHKVAVKSELLAQNVSLLQSSIMGKNTSTYSIWTTEDGTSGYFNETQLLSAGTHGSTWKDPYSSDIYKTAIWAQLREAMEKLRYILYTAYYAGEENWNDTTENPADYWYGTGSDDSSPVDYDTRNTYADAESEMLGDFAFDSTYTKTFPYVYMNYFGWIRYNAASPPETIFSLNMSGFITQPCVEFFDAFYAAIDGDILDSGICIKSVFTLQGMDGPGIPDFGGSVWSFSYPGLTPIYETPATLNMQFDHGTVSITSTGDGTPTETKTSYNLAGAKITGGTFDIVDMDTAPEYPQFPHELEFGTYPSPNSLPHGEGELTFEWKLNDNTNRPSSNPYTISDYTYYLTDIAPLVSYI